MSLSTVTKALRSVGRIRKVAAVFASHGYGHIVRRLDLPLPGTAASKTVGPDGRAKHLRMAFEELGPAFVKLGQTLSMRPDLLPADFIEELSRLQDRVPPVPYDEVALAIQEALGGTPEELFHSFDPEPIAAASIGQVHGATLLDEEGQVLDVVVKVRRPGIRKIVDQDLRVVSLLAEGLVTYVPESRALNPQGLVDEFFKTIRKELDFREELASLKTIAANFEDRADFLVIPKVYEHLSSEAILTMERLRGVPLSATEEIHALDCDLKELAQQGAECLLDMIFEHGFFHGDLHAGNLFIFGDGRIGVIDFGIIGRLDPRGREMVADLLLNLVNGDYRRAARLYAELGDRIDPDNEPNIEAFSVALSKVWEPSRNRSLKDINVGELLLEGSRAGANSGIMLPQELLLLFKALLTLEAMGRTLDPDFDVSGVARAYMEGMLARRFDPKRLQQAFLGTSMDLYTLTRDGPTLLLDMMKRLGDGALRHEVQVKHMEQMTQSLSASASRVASAIVIAGLAVASSALLTAGDSMIVTAVGMGLGLFGLLIASFFMIGFLRSLWKA